jgi:mRNA interferase HigB
VKVLGEAAAARFAGKHAGARKPLQRFLDVARNAVWPNFPAVKQTFPSVDLGRQSRRLIFDIGGNRFRLIASVDFEEQMLLIERVMTHEEYDRENW